MIMEQFIPDKLTTLQMLLLYKRVPPRSDHNYLVWLGRDTTLPIFWVFALCFPYCTNNDTEKKNVLKLRRSQRGCRDAVHIEGSDEVDV